MAGGIDIKVTELGGAEVAETFRRAESGLRAHLQQELDDIGSEIVLAARGMVARETGATMRRIVHRHGKQTRRGFQGEGDKLTLTVLPGEPVGHLLERGVNATISRRRNRAADVRGVTKTGRKSRKLVALGIRFVKPYRLVIPPRPFFQPAIDSLGGPAGVNARLQAAIDRVASTAERGA